MTRRRAGFAGATALVVVLAVVLVALVAGGDDEPSRPDASPAELAYARGWQATCTALRADAERTTTLLRRRTGDRPPGAAARRRLARSVVAPYLGRAERRLRRQAAAAPPPAWRPYHRDAARALLRAADRTAAARTRVRQGGLAALRDLDPAALAVAPPAPEGLRARTPACAP